MPAGISSRGRARARFCLTVFVALVFHSAIPGLRAQETSVRLDPAKTKIEFTLGDVLHTVHGRFDLKTGLIRFDPSTGKISGQVVADATSGESGNGTRDRKMQKEVLESEKFPEITFTPNRWKGALSGHGTSRIEIAGRFSMHGQDHEVTLPIDVRADGRQLTIASQIIIPYVQWGVKNPSTFILRVSDKVTIDIHAVVQLDQPVHSQ